jgi:hypothetical protein
MVERMHPPLPKLPPIEFLQPAKEEPAEEPVKKESWVWGIVPALIGGLLGAWILVRFVF